MKTRILSATSLFFSCALLSTGVAGQIVSTGKEAKQIEQGCPPALQLIAKFNSSYVFESDFERGHDAKGDALSNQAEVDYRIPIGGRTRLREARGAEPAIDAQWLLRLGARYERFDFDHGGGLPLPNVLQSVAAVIAIELFVDCDESRVDADPLVMIETRPGLYGGQNLDTDDFNAPTIAYFPIKWIASRSFIPVLGVAYDGFRKNPILPFVAFRWTINNYLTIQANPEQPRIVYSANKNLELWLGGEYAGDSFRADARGGKKHRDLNEAVVTYSEWRAGVGVAWKTDRCRLDLNAGYAFQRKFDFHRAEEGYKTDEGAPYIAAAFAAGF